jgi:hypothetical protein
MSMPSLRSCLLSVALVSLLGACGSDYSIFGGHSDSNPPAQAADAGTSAMDAGNTQDGVDAGTGMIMVVDSGGGGTAPTCRVGDAFGTPTLVTEVNSATLDSEPKVSADELTMLFSSLRAMTAGNAEWAPFISKRASKTDVWGAPVLLTQLDDPTAIDADPFITEDGLTAFISSDRNNDTGLHLYMATRPSIASPFGTPALVGAVDTPKKNIEAAIVSPVGNELYFHADAAGTLDLYHSSYSVLGIGAPVLISELSTPSSADSDAALTGDELTMFFSSDRTGTLGQADVWVATRASTATAWGTPRHLAELSSSGADLVGSVSRDGCRIWFARCATGTGLACIAAFDIYAAVKQPR